MSCLVDTYPCLPSEIHQDRCHQEGRCTSWKCILPGVLSHWGIEGIYTKDHKRHSMLSKKREEYTQTYHMCGGMFPTRCGIPSLLCRYRYFWKHHLFDWKRIPYFNIFRNTVYFNECNEYEIAYTCSQGATEPMYYRLPSTTGWELNMVPFCPGNMK